MRIAEIFRSIQGEGRLTGVDSVFVRASGCNLRCRWCDTPYASWTPEGDDLTAAEILDQVQKLAKNSPLPLGEGSGVRAENSSPLLLGEGSGARAENSSPLPLGEGSGVRATCTHVVLTGGEPMLFAELIPLAAALREREFHITIETAGTLYLPVVCNLMSISPKLSNSTPSAELDPRWAWRHTLNRHAPEVIRRLLAEYDCQLKFVVDRADDFREIEAYLAEFPEIERSQVMLMPQGVEADELAEKAVWLEPYCEARGYAFCPRRQIEWFGAERGT
ncbi:MAG: 7-carboxy-7-deazaguanine synthase QueE [Pirellulales bacterium]|nr:7-carboxy-7-deazaguanine synthase QueE [Pirellulales bacterium]